MKLREDLPKRADVYSSIKFEKRTSTISHTDGCYCI